MPEIRVAIVEDEPPARAKLRRMLGEHAEYRIVVEADDVAGGLAALRDDKIDLLFLDIQLGAESGFDLITLAALAYLLKPFDRERFARCLVRVAERLAERREYDGGSADEERLRRLGADLVQLPRLQRIVVHERGRSLVVPMAEVQRLSASGNYVEVHTDTKRHLARATLSRLAQRLDPGEFLRVHRSHLVHADFIKAIAPWAHGNLKLRLRDGSELMLSRRYRALLPEGWNRV